MSGLNIKTWALWDWVGVVSILVAAIILALNAALKEAPVLASNMSGLLDSAVWAYLPLVLIVVFVIAAVMHSRAQIAPKPKEAFTPDELEQLRYAGRPVFRLVPQYFTVELVAQLPYVEARFFVVNFLPRPTILTQAKFSLQLYSAPALEMIPLSQDDLLLHPHEALIVTFRRNLSDSELRALPWQAGRTSASFQLSAKAQDGDKAHSYGPVSSMVIDGWVNVPLKPVS